MWTGLILISNWLSCYVLNDFHLHFQWIYSHSFPWTERIIIKDFMECRWTSVKWDNIFVIFWFLGAIFSLRTFRYFDDKIGVVKKVSVLVMHIFVFMAPKPYLNYIWFVNTHIEKNAFANCHLPGVANSWSTELLNLFTQLLQFQSIMWYTMFMVRCL